MTQQLAYDRLLDRLEEMGRSYATPRGRGENWSLISCPGPIHTNGDRHPSLVVRRQRGRARLTYKTGCYDVDVLAAMDRDIPDLFDNGREVTYPYADGWTVHRSWDAEANDKKIWQDKPKVAPKGKKTQLYQAERVKAAVAAGWTIMLVEGEDNADLINSLPEEERGRVFATTARMGSDSFHLCDVEPLRGARVIAVVDRDESGDKWARQVKTMVRPIAADLVFKRSKFARETADVADHIMHGYSLAELEPYVSPALTGLRTGDWLDRQEFDPLEWIVPDLIPEGFTLLVGSPKIGKSWMLLSIGLAAATGGYVFGKILCEPRPVFLLALEDSDRRMKSRIRKLLRTWEAIPPALHYVTRLKAPVLDTIEEWLDTLSPRSRPLVILDTVGRVLPPPQRSETTYDRDYRFSTTLQQVTADRPGMGLIGAHHNRKAAAEDFVEMISGTHGLGGGADTVLVIDRKRNQPRGLLKMTSRETEENEYAVKLIDAEWTLEGDDLSQAAEAAEVVHEVKNLGGLSTKIVIHLDQHPEEIFTPASLAPTMAEPRDKVQRYLHRLADMRKIAKIGRGMYQTLSASSGVSGNRPDETDTPDDADKTHGKEPLSKEALNWHLSVSDQTSVGLIEVFVGFPPDHCSWHGDDMDCACTCHTLNGKEGER